MDDREERNTNFDQLGPTYKSLFIGACLVIGSAFGWWFTNFISAVESRFFGLEHRVTELEAKLLREAWERDALQEEVNQLKRQGRTDR